MMKRATGPAAMLTRRTMLGAGSAAMLTTSVAGCGLFGAEPKQNGAGVGGAGESNRSGEREAPMLAARVEAGELPPVQERLPETPLVVQPLDQLGVYGGEWRTALFGPADASWLVSTIMYDQLMRWNPELTAAIPNLAESVDVSDDGQEFTIHLRAGMKWSDGEPFTADDIVFAYDDVYSNEELFPALPSWLVAGGEPPVFELVDAITVRVSFAAPAGLFLQHLAIPNAWQLTATPRHYLERFHIDYNPTANDLAEEEGFADWTELFHAKSGRAENAELPTLYPFRLLNALGAGTATRVVAERNPYYWKTDPDGRQLPYIDRVVYTLISNSEAIVLAAANGELDLYMHDQVTTVANKPVLARTGKEGGYRLFDLIPAGANTNYISLNLAHKDPVKREIFQNKDFRIGLSHAINRQEIINAVYQRQGQPWQIAPRLESDFYDEEFGKQYTEFDVDLANQHLDQAGYVERDNQGWRLGPDGRPISFDIDVNPSASHRLDTIDLVVRYWRDVGVDARLNVADGALLGVRINANAHDVRLSGGGGGLNDLVLDPRYYVPVHPNGDFWAIPWANWYNDKEPNEEPPPATRRQMEIYDQVKATVDDDERNELMRQILAIAKNEFYVIGIALSVGSYAIVKNSFHNVPEPMLRSASYPAPGNYNPEQFHISDQ